MTAPPIPIVVTDEMRQAVYSIDCGMYGHMIDIMGMLSPTGQVEAATANAVPYLSCHRCHKVWVIVETPGVDYATAVDNYNAVAKPDHQKDRTPPKTPKGP